MWEGGLARSSEVGTRERSVSPTGIRSMVLNHFRPDVFGVVETCLRGDEVISVLGYTWLGND